MMIWLRVAAFSAVVAALATATSPWQEGAAAESCENDCGQGLFQKSLARVGQGRSMQATNPLDKRVYLIMCWHKSGSNLIRNTMRWIFDLLGVTDACRSARARGRRETDEGGGRRRWGEGEGEIV
ncbi:unnamed protein product, partial [Durusdinium trenchii]